MSGWTLASLTVLAGAVGIGWIAARHLLRSPPSRNRRREASLLTVVTGLSVSGFALAHLYLNHEWGSEGIGFANWWWLAYALGFAAALWLAHGAFRRLRLGVDDVVLPVVGLAMLLGLLNVWIWETRDANAFVSSVALPEMRDLEIRVGTADDMDARQIAEIDRLLGEVPNELTFEPSRGPANVLNSEWVDDFNAARDRYTSASAVSPPSLPTRSLPPVVVDNLFRRQLIASVIAVLSIPAIVAAAAAVAVRRSVLNLGLVGGSVLLIGLAALGIAQGTSGRLPAFVQVGGIAVTVFSVTALGIVVVLPVTLRTRSTTSRYWIVGAAAVALATVSMIAVDTGAGLLLALIVATGLTATLTSVWRRRTYATAAIFGLIVMIALVGGGIGFLPDRAASRIESWSDPWATHSDAEIENAAARSVEGISALAGAPGTDAMSPADAVRIVDAELRWRLDSFDGEADSTYPVIPRSKAEELVLREAELLWSDLGGYRVDGDQAAHEVLSARIERALAVIDESGSDLTGRGDEAFAAMTADVRPDGLQLQRSFFGLHAGGVLGVGLAAGHPEAVPEITEDMAIVFVGEAFGLVGTAVVVGLVVLLASRSIARSRSLEGARSGILAGTGLLLGVQALVNLGGVTGALPFTGIPFPLISRSGTGLLATCAGIGIALFLASGTVTTSGAPMAAARETRDRMPLRFDPLAVTALILLANLAAIQVFGRQLAPGPVGASAPTSDPVLITAANARDLPDYRSAPGPILDRNGLVLAHTSAYGTRSYPDQELAESLSHSLSELERSLPAVDGATGPSITTTIDGEVQRALHRAIDDAALESEYVNPEGLRGAVVVIDIETGELIAIESRPTFSPSELDDDSAWASAEGEDRRSGFYYRHLNRALDGSYPPGSVLKVVTAAASLEHGLHELGSEDFDFRSGPMGPRPPDDVKHFSIWHEVRFDDGGAISDGHLGVVDEWLFDLEEALAYSSNVSFALMAVELGSERFTDTTDAFGFELDHTIPYYGSFSSTVGAPDEAGLRYLEATESGLALSGLGQGDVLMSPIHLGLVPAAIANQGVAMSPFIVRELVHADGERQTVGEPTPLFDTGLSDQTLEDLGVMMSAAVDYGTAQNAASPHIEPEMRTAGKTGSAQWSEELDRTHSVFMGYHPRSEPRLAISVIIERGGPGGGVAAGIARHLLESDAVARYLESVDMGGDGS